MAVYKYDYIMFNINYNTQYLSSTEVTKIVTKIFRYIH